MEKHAFPKMSAVFILLTVLPALLPAGVLPRFGVWLRGLSLESPSGNLAAWGIVAALSLLPALGLFWTPRQKCDFLLLAAAGEIFAGLFLLVNPSLVITLFDGRQFVAIAFTGCLTATVLAWAVLRGLGSLERSPAPGRALELLLKWAAVLIGWLAAWSQGAETLQKIREVAEANTMPGVSLAPTNFFLILLGIAGAAPPLLGCAALLLAGKLVRAIEADPFSEETVALAGCLSRDCRRIAAASVLIYAVGNLLQFCWLPFLLNTNFTVSFPLFSVLLAAALELLCRYFRKAKAVSDDNDSII